MDNITHTLTGALAAKVVRVPDAEREQGRKTLFWLLLVSANLPDIDIISRFVTDPITALTYHRGITHSLVFAPVFALLPALVFYRFGKLKRLNTLWLSAWLGITIHIFFDFITPFGTQLFLPLSTRRFSLDWMFIVDPFFTILLAAGLWAGRRWRGKRLLPALTVAVVVAYLALEAVCHQVAEGKVRSYALSHGLGVDKISAFPQPLNLFHWMGIVQTDQGMEQMFFLLSDDSVSSTAFPPSHSALTQRTLELPEAQWYLLYARYPWVHEVREGDSTVVEFRDLQFSVDPLLVRRFGMPERDIPFVLRYIYAPTGRLSEVRFDRTVIRRLPDA